MRTHCVRCLTILSTAVMLAISSPDVRAQDARPAPKPKKLDPRDAWVAAFPRLIQANRESDEAMQARLAGIVKYLVERKAGSRPFAEAVLSLKGKAIYAGGLAEQAIGAVAGLFGFEPSGPDSFTQFVRDRYREHMLDPGQLQKVIDAAIAGYAGDVQAIENQFLVDLRVDLADEALDLKKLLPPAEAADMRLSTERAANRAIEAAGEDFLTSIVTSAISWIASDVIGNKLTKESDSTSKKLGVNVAAGMAVDKAIDGALKQAGYDPLAKVAGEAATSLETVGGELIDGDVILAEDFPRMLLLSIGHPSEKVRAACLEAVEAMARSPYLGLRQRIYLQQLERARRRALALYSQIFGPDAEVPDALIHPPIALDDVPDDEELIRYAADLKSLYGGTK
jgi:hypothetical protein